MTYKAILQSDIDTVTHTSNRILDQNLLSFRNIGEVSVLPPMMNLSISVIILNPQTLMTPMMQEIFADTTSGNVWKNRTLRRIIRTGIDGSFPISTPIHSGIRKTYSQASSESTGTRISIGTSITITAPPDESIWISGVGNKRKSATPNLGDSNKLDSSIDGNFANNFVVPPIFTDAVSDKISNSSIRYLYARIGMHLESDPTNSMTPQLVGLGFSTIYALDKVAGLWTPATRVGSPTYVSHWSAADHIFGETTAVGDSVGANSDYNYLTGF